MKDVCDVCKGTGLIKILSKDGKRRLNINCQCELGADALHKLIDKDDRELTMNRI